MISSREKITKELAERAIRKGGDGVEHDLIMEPRLGVTKSREEGSGEDQKIQRVSVGWGVKKVLVEELFCGIVSEERLK